MTPCPPDNSTWCCGDSRGCCGSKDAVTIPPVFGTQTSTSAAQISTSAPSAATITSFVNNTSPNHTIDGGVIAGIVVGILGAAAITGIAAWIMSRRRARRQLNSVATIAPPTHQLKDQTPLSQSKYSPQAGIQAAELDSRTRRPEIDSQNIRIRRG